MNYTIYNILTGQIDSLVSCPENALVFQYDPNSQKAIEGHFSDLEFYVENGTVTKLPIKPSSHHTFDYLAKQWVDSRNIDTEWLTVKYKRNQLLAISDWTQLPDVPLDTKEAWAVYRQALRDITDQPDPFNIVWPEPPQ